jgi:hypothetical protein
MFDFHGAPRMRRLFLNEHTGEILTARKHERP